MRMGPKNCSSEQLAFTVAAFSLLTLQRRLHVSSWRHSFCAGVIIRRGDFSPVSISQVQWLFLYQTPIVAVLFQQQPKLRRRNSRCFFPQSYLEVTEKVMGKYTGQNMMMPTWKLSHLILVHPQLCFRLGKALLNGPAQPTQPNECFQTATRRGI